MTDLITRQTLLAEIDKAIKEDRVVSVQSFYPLFKEHKNPLNKFDLNKQKEKCIWFKISEVV